MKKMSLSRHFSRTPTRSGVKLGQTGSIRANFGSSQSCQVLEIVMGATKIWADFDLTLILDYRLRACLGRF